MSATTESVVANAPKQLFMGGEWVDGACGKTLDVIDPSTGEVLTSVADASPADGQRALDAAVAAQAEFAKMAPRKRSDILMKAFHLMHERIEDLARLMTLEMGKPLAEARGEIVYAAEFFRHFAEEAVRISGGYQVAPAGGARFIVTSQPVGPCLLITPWNFPMAMGTRKLGPAIAAGCTSVVKPAAQTPLSMLALAGILKDAGLPAGVVNVVVTSNSGGVMEPLIRGGQARKLSFTGSTGVGVKLLEQSAGTVLRTSMELGGNAPFLVFDDADLDKAVEGAMLAKMRNSGEACTAANRIYVQEGVAAEFSRKLTERMKAIVMGRGVDDGVTLGPMIDEKAIASIDELVKDAVDKGADVLTGGKQGDRAGYFYEPTVLANVPPSARVNREEIFGPVAPIGTFTDEADALAKANDTEFGLIAYLFTNDLTRALRVAEGLEAGMVGINQGVVSNPAAPFGGMKQSGLGREGGAVGIDEYLEIKYIGVALPE